MPSPRQDAATHMRLIYLHPDRAGEQQLLHGGHGGHQGGALLLAQRLQHCRRRVVGEPVQRGDLLAAGRREDHVTHASIAGGVTGADQAFGFERPEQPAQVAGVEAEPRAQRSDFATFAADLEEQAGGPERPGTAEEMSVECTDLAGHRAIEASDPSDPLHSLTLVRDRPPGKPAADQGAKRPENA